MKISKNIFRAYDIRGKYPQEVSPDFAYRLGYFFNDFLVKAKISKNKNLRILVNADLRKSSQLLKKKLIEGLSHNEVSHSKAARYQAEFFRSRIPSFAPISIRASEGLFSSPSSPRQVAGYSAEENKNIILDLGQSTTPMFYFGIKKTKVDFGIMVTASHLPQDYNGFKIFDKNITAIGGDKIGKFVKMFQGDVGNPPTLKLRRTSVNLLDEYVNFLIKHFNFKPEERKFLKRIKIAINDQFGIATPILKKLLPRLNLPIKLFNEKSDARFRKIVKNSFDLGVYFDADGDRVIFVDKRGDIISSDIIGPILVQYFAQLNKKAKIVIDETTTKLVAEIIKEYGGKVVYSKIGHAYFKVKMAKEKAIFGLEKSGHYYFKDFYFADSGIFAFLIFLKAFVFYGESLDNLQEDFEKYAIASEINFKIKNYQKIINAMKRKFGRMVKKTSVFNGLTMDFGNWRFNIRPSNTEPILRFNMEADNEKMLKEKMVIVKNIIKNELTKNKTN